MQYRVCGTLVYDGHEPGETFEAAPNAHLNWAVDAGFIEPCSAPKPSKPHDEDKAASESPQKEN